MSEPLRVLLASRLKRKPAPDVTTRHLPCPSGYVGTGEDQVRTATWNVPTQSWVYGDWQRVAYNCILQPSYMEAFIPGDGSKYGNFTGTLAGYAMAGGVVSPSFVSSLAGYTANYDIGLRGPSVTDAHCLALGLNPERIVYVNQGDFIHYNFVSYLNHNYGGGFITFDVRNPAAQSAFPWSGKAETVGGFATINRSYVKGYSLSADGNTVTRGPIIGDFEICMAGFSSGMVCSGANFYLQIMRNAIPASIGSWNVKRVVVSAQLQAAGGAQRWYDDPSGVRFYPEGQMFPIDDAGNYGYNGRNLTIQIPSPGVLVMYDTDQHSRAQPPITGNALATPPIHAFNRGSGNSDALFAGALVIPVNPGTVTIGPNWCPYDSRSPGFLAYDNFFGFAPF